MLIKTEWKRKERKRTEGWERRKEKKGEKREGTHNLSSFKSPVREVDLFKILLSPPLTLLPLVERSVERGWFFLSVTTEFRAPQTARGCLGRRGRWV